MARILMVSSEAAPFAKSGGLADVLGALPQALVERGDQVAVVLPKYGFIDNAGMQRMAERMRVWAGSNYADVNVDRLTRRGVDYLFVDFPPLYGRNGLYGEWGRDYGDNHLRFALLPLAAIEIARSLFLPDVFHVHDWQAALLPVYLDGWFRHDPTFFHKKTVMTIHNLGYQGIFGWDVPPFIGLGWQTVHSGVFEYYGNVSFLKAGLVKSHWLTTVSPTYAREIQTPELGHGIDGLLRTRSAELTGILNGVDYTEWNPETDPLISAHYSARSLEGKQACKLDLLAEMGLPPEAAGRPLLGIVSRFAHQKGFDLIAQAGWELANEDLTLVVLGTGERQYEDLFRSMQGRFPGKVAARIAYDNRLAHKIEAGADMFLMPSRYEPCGLNQIYSLRYGTVPLVRATGGLDDTVDPETGFKFWGYTSWEMMGMIRYALAAFRQRDGWVGMMKAGMGRDFSWTASAGKYADLYQQLMGRDVRTR
jgi:starch synthase